MPNAPRSCQYGACGAPATIALRFGDGTYRHGARRIERQSLVSYCDRHGAIVELEFHVCDVESLASVSRAAA